MKENGVSDRHNAWKRGAYVVPFAGAQWCDWVGGTFFWLRARPCRVSVVIIARLGRSHSTPETDWTRLSLQTAVPI
jgi:hypothetical protein